ncbi:MAG: site-specific DNA-methyltransferase, partial [Cardiobacterium sp.]
DIWRPNLLTRSDEASARYKNPDNGPRGVWEATDFSVKTYSAANDYPITTPTGRIVNPPESRCWVTSKERFNELVADNRIWFGKTGNNVPSLKKFLTEVKDGTTALTVWLYEEVGHNQDAKKEVKQFNSKDVFDTPKPERLLERILTLATSPGDLVLDSFAGSGTTGAVAHKMGRRWIMVELGEHCHTHIIPRLQKVIDGEDQGGISKAVNWQGGGGFRYYKLAPTLIVNDHWGNQIINPAYNAAQLAEALAKIQGFTYQPSETLWWQHGYSSERDFIYVTTQNLSVSQLQTIANEVGAGRSLLICCSAFHGISAAQAAERWPNLTLCKIPREILHRCEWGHDDYSLNVANLPMATAEKAADSGDKAAAQGDLFAGDKS